MTQDTKLLPEEVAVYLDVTVRTLANWRSSGEGPQYYKPNDKKVYYFKGDLDTWIKGGGCKCDKTEDLFNE